jgi:hypothetical protein
MPNRINAKNPMPTNSTSTATKSYSSQCGLPERMMCYPYFKMSVARIGGHLTPRFDADQKFTHHFLDAARVIGPERPLALLIWIKHHLRLIG